MDIGSEGGPVDLPIPEGKPVQQQAPVMTGQQRFWFAPRMCSAFTQEWLRPRPTGLFFFGGCLFWLVLIYVYVAIKAVQLVIWLIVVIMIWIAQLFMLPALIHEGHIPGGHVTPRADDTPLEDRPDWRG